MAHLSRSTAARRIEASGLIGLASGVATVTAAQEAVNLYQQLAEQMWSRAAKGVSGAALLRKCLKEPQI